MTGIRNIPFGRPWITDDDRNAVMEVLNGPILTHGPQCKAFESEFSEFVGGSANCVTVSSCMAALHLAYLHLGIGPGDEVIVPAQTHSATVHAAEWVGATPVFVDCDPATGNMTPEGIAAAITAQTKAISVVHFVGIPCRMPEIVEIAERHNLKIVEDCAIALGSRYSGTHVGLFGDVGTFSFYPVKHITTGEGGMFMTRHPDVAAAVNKLRAFGVDRSHTERAIPGSYDVPSLGLNYRMSEMQAALGRTQLRRFQQNLDMRRSNFEELKQGLSGIPNIRVLDSAGPEEFNSHYCLSMVLEGPLQEKRNEAVARLNSAGIGTSIYYPQPVPRMTYYRNKYGYDQTRYPEAARISDQSIALPVAPHVGRDDIQYMARIVAETVEELNL
ncbi:MAG: DegT/DnrJ/EryC1/StrS family aminotransferase [Thermodesulfobacteriota bacterium]